VPRFELPPHLVKQLRKGRIRLALELMADPAVSQSLLSADLLFDEIWRQAVPR
jgi:hypothetical protein